MSDLVVFPAVAFDDHVAEVGPVDRRQDDLVASSAAVGGFAGIGRDEGGVDQLPAADEQARDGAQLNKGQETLQFDAVCLLWGAALQGAAQAVTVAQVCL